MRPPRAMVATLAESATRVERLATSKLGWVELEPASRSSAAEAVAAAKAVAPSVPPPNPPNPRRPRTTFSSPIHACRCIRTWQWFGADQLANVGRGIAGLNVDTLVVVLLGDALACLAGLQVIDDPPQIAGQVDHDEGIAAALHRDHLADAAHHLLDVRDLIGCDERLQIDHDLHQIAGRQGMQLFERDPADQHRVDSLISRPESEGDFAANQDEVLGQQRLVDEIGELRQRVLPGLAGLRILGGVEVERSVRRLLNGVEREAGLVGVPLDHVLPRLLAHGEGDQLRLRGRWRLELRRPLEIDLRGVHLGNVGDLGKLALGSGLRQRREVERRWRFSSPEAATDEGRCQSRSRKGTQPTWPLGQK